MRVGIIPGDGNIMHGAEVTQDWIVVGDDGASVDYQTLSQSPYVDDGGYASSTGFRPRGLGLRS